MFLLKYCFVNYNLIISIIVVNLSFFNRGFAGDFCYGAFFLSLLFVLFLRLADVLLPYLFSIVNFSACLCSFMRFFVHAVCFC